MTKIRTWVGLDVHARVTHAGILDADSGELRRLRVAGPPERVLEQLEVLARPLLAVYEAGPTGYGLARLGAERGLELRVCAPGLVARRPVDRVKTDARDAERLARLLAAGDLTFVRVPSECEEQLRDRLDKELLGNVSIRLEPTETPEQVKVVGRGELQLSILIEMMRREGFELQVSRPDIVTKNIKGQVVEPVEELVIDVPEDYQGLVIAQVGERRGTMTKMVSHSPTRRTGRSGGTRSAASS